MNLGQENLKHGSLNGKDRIVNDCCRICGNFPDTRLVYIYGHQSVTNHLSSKINLHLPIKVSMKDALPLHVCVSCEQSVLAWDYLYQCCIDADTKMRSMLGSQYNFNDQGIQERVDENSETVCIINEDPLGDLNPVSIAVSSTGIQTKHGTQSTDFHSGSAQFRDENKFEESLVVAKIDSLIRNELMEEDDSQKHDNFKTHKSLLFHDSKEDADSAERSKFVESQEKKTDSQNVKKRRALSHKKLISKEKKAKIISNKPDSSEHEAHTAELCPNGESESTSSSCKPKITVMKPAQSTWQNNTKITRKIFQAFPEFFSRDCMPSSDNKIYKTSSSANSPELFEDLTILYDLIEVHFPSNVANYTLCPECTSFQLSKGLHDKHFIRHEFYQHLTEQHIATMRFYIRKAITPPSEMLKKHLKSEWLDGKKVFRCRKCAKPYLRKINCQNHERYHTKDRPYACPCCPKRFYLADVIMKHIEGCHLNIGLTYPCNFCSMVCPSVLSMRKHVVRMHRADSGNLNLLQFACKICGQGFPQKNKLNLHVKVVHQNKEPYFCEICHKTYPFRHLLIAHQKTHLTEFQQIHHCQLCKRKFKSEIKLEYHIRNDHAVETERADVKEIDDMDKLQEKNYYYCKECPKSFSERRSVWLHYRHLHPGTRYFE